MLLERNQRRLRLQRCVPTAAAVAGAAAGAAQPAAAQPATAQLTARAAASLATQPPAHLLPRLSMRRCEQRRKHVCGAGHEPAGLPSLNPRPNPNPSPNPQPQPQPQPQP